MRLGLVYCSPDCRAKTVRRRLFCFTSQSEGQTMKRSMGTLATLALITGWGLMTASEAHQKEGEQPKPVAEEKKSEAPEKPKPAAPPCANCAKPKATDYSVNQHCPVFPLYPLYDDVWLFYCDGFDRTGEMCNYQEATTIEAVDDGTWPYTECTQAPCVGSLFKAARGSTARRFTGYGRPHVTKDQTRWDFVHTGVGSAAPLAFTWNTKSILRVNHGGGGGYRDYKLFKMLLPDRAATWQEDPNVRHRIIGFQIRLEDTVAAGEVNQLNYGAETDPVRSIPGQTHVFKVMPDAGTSRPAMVLVRRLL